MTARIAVLASGSGSNLQALLDAGDLGGGRVVLVATENPGAGALDRAEQAGVATTVVPFREFGNRGDWEAALTDAVAAASPDLVVLAGFMKILGGAFVGRWPTVNVHPSLLPAFPGARAPAEAVAWGVKLSGVTVHYVDEQVDHGPIIAQEAVPVRPDDTADTLHARMQAVEHRLLPAVVADICAGRVEVRGRHVHVEPAPTAPVPTAPVPTAPATPAEDPHA